MTLSENALSYARTHLIVSLVHYSVAIGAYVVVDEALIMPIICVIATVVGTVGFMSSARFYGEYDALINQGM